MASNNIGNASLAMSANGSKLLGDLNSTSAGIKGWADKTKATLGGAFKGVAGGAAGGVAGGMLGGLKGALLGIGSGVGAMFGPVGLAIGTAVGGVATGIVGAVTAPFDKLKEFGQIVKTSESLGISASQFQGLSQALAKVGVEGGEATATFAKLGKKVAEGAGGGEAAKAFSDLGLNAKALAALPLDEQFKQVADAIAKLPPGGQQAAAAMKLFEDAGVKLLPVLQKGGQGLQDFIDKQKKFGAVLSDSQLKAAGEAAKAWKESKDTISAVWDGLVNRATLIAAPIIKFIGNGVSKAFALLSPVFDWLGRVVGEIARVAEAVFEVLSGWFEEAVTWVTELAGEVQSFTGTWPSVEDVVLVVLKNVAQAIGYVWDTLKAGVGIVAIVVGKITELFGQLVGRFKDTIKSLLEIAGRLPDSLGGGWFRKAAGEVDGFGNKLQEAGQGMQAWGVAQMDAFGNSPVKIGAWFDKLKDRAKKEGDKAKKEIEANIPKPEYKPVAAMLKGSKEAYSVESRFLFENKGQGKKVDEKQLEVQKAMAAGINALLNVFKGAAPLVAG